MSLPFLRPSFLKRLLKHMPQRDHSADQSADQITTNFWNEHGDSSYRGETYWLANPAINRRYQLKAAGGRDYQSWINFTVQHYFESRSPVDRILSIGCGDGALERHLMLMNAAKIIEGIDLSPKRVELAKQEALKAGLQNHLHYRVCNAETADFSHDAYAAIYFNSSLHHMSNLGAILLGCKDALQSEGLLFVNEYIGPNRFDFSDREKQVMQSAFQMIPEQYRISHAEHDRGALRTQVQFPDPAAVEELDPSEAIHSAEIVDALQQHFDIQEFNETGGTLMQFMLQDIAGNFKEDDPAAMQILQMIFTIEDTLIASADLQPHFALIIARPRHRS